MLKMQLKMTKSGSNFDVFKIRKILIAENKFMCDLLSRTDLPTPLKGQEESEDDNENEMESKKNEQTSTNLKEARINSVQTKRAKSLEELHDRLNEIKKKKRLQYVDKLLKKNLKSRVTKKQRKEERSQKRKLVKVQKAGGLSNGIKSENHVDDKEDVKVPKPVYNSEEKIVFSKFNFSEIETKKANTGEKDPKKILDKLKKQKEKLKDLVNSGEKDKAVELKEKLAWKSALAKAGGQKVKDDPELLKKSVKRLEQRKKKSSKKWEERGEALKKAEHAKQKKREDNINKRKKDKKNKKLKQASNRGRIIPGF